MPLLLRDTRALVKNICSGNNKRTYLRNSKTGWKVPQTWVFLGKSPIPPPCRPSLDASAIVLVLGPQGKLIEKWSAFTAGTFRQLVQRAYLSIAERQREDTCLRPSPTFFSSFSYINRLVFIYNFIIGGFFPRNRS